MRNATAFYSIIGKCLWKVWKGFGSLLLFEFGAKKRDVITGTVHGAYCLWIYMAAWRIKKDGKEIANSESSDIVIERSTAALQGKRLDAVILSCFVTRGELHCAARFEFEGGRTVQAFMNDRDGSGSIFMLHTPSAVFSYDYDGALTESKKKQNRPLHRTAAQLRSLAIQNSRKGRHLGAK